MLKKIIKIFNKKLQKKSALMIVFSFLIITVTTLWGTDIYKAKQIKADVFNIGGIITKVNDACLLDASTCSSCPMCYAANNTACGGQQEIVFTPFGGSGNFICPVKGFPCLGGKARSGGQILGSGTAQNAMAQMGCS